MKHTLTLLLFLPLFLAAQESQTPIFVAPGQTVTAQDSAYLIGLPRLHFYQWAVTRQLNEEPGLYLDEIETAFRTAQSQFNEIYQLNQTTNEEIKKGLEKAAEKGDRANSILVQMALQNAENIEAITGLKGDVKRLGRKQFWNKIGLFGGGALAGVCAGFLLTK